MRSKFETFYILLRNIILKNYNFDTSSVFFSKYIINIVPIIYFIFNCLNFSYNIITKISKRVIYIIIHVGIHKIFHVCKLFDVSIIIIQLTAPNIILILILANF